METYSTMYRDGSPMDEMESEARQLVLRLVGATGVPWEYVVSVGSPGEEIVTVAEEVGADLIVVGSNRHSSAISSVGDPDVSMALVPPSQSAVQWWDMKPIGGKSS